MPTYDRMKTESTNRRLDDSTHRKEDFFESHCKERDSTVSFERRIN